MRRRRQHASAKSQRIYLSGGHHCNADTMVGSVSHNDITVLIHCHSVWPEKSSHGALSVLMTRLASARQCGYQAL
eukprot:1054020-Prorocentrum_minimum.AAC.1